MTTSAERENARAFVRRGIEMAKRGRPRKAIHIAPDDDFAFISKPIYRRYCGKSQSNPGRICRTTFCRVFVSDKNADCPQCGAKP